MKGATIEKNIPLFDIASLDNDRYLGVESRYLAGNPALVNCNLLDLSGILSRKDTRKQSLGIPSSALPAMVNCVYDVQAQPTPSILPQRRPSQPTPSRSSTEYPPPRGVPWKRIAAMVRSDMSCPGCNFNKPDHPTATSSTERLDSQHWQSPATYSGRTSRHWR